MGESIDNPGLLQWIERSLQSGDHLLAVSNQGTLLRYREGGADLVVKAAMGREPLRSLRQRTLLREYEAYRRMEGLAGVPRCHGLLAGRYLVLEFISGTPYREAEWVDRERWFDEFLAVLRGIHGRGVAHGDLKSKSNILVTEAGRPCVIDFGTAFVLKPGVHPVNNWLFRHARRMDLNAYVKHKYHGRYEDIRGDDLQLLDYSRIEYWVRRLSGRPVGQIPRR